MDCVIDVVGYLNLHEFGNLLFIIVKGGALLQETEKSKKHMNHLRGETD